MGDDLRVRLSPGLQNAALTGTKSFVSGTTFALYMGKCPVASDTVKVRYRITTKSTATTWAEVAIATGSVVMAGNPSLSVKAFTDVSTVISGTGQFTTTVGSAGARILAAGDDVWILFGFSGSGAPIARAASIADDLQIGYQASAALRPSTFLGGAAQTFTIEGATALPILLAIGY